MEEAEEGQQQEDILIEEEEVKERVATFHDIPSQVLGHVLSYLDPKNIDLWINVNKAFYNASYCNFLWDIWFNQKYPSILPPLISKSNHNNDQLFDENDNECALPYKATYASRHLIKTWLNNCHGLMVGTQKHPYNGLVHAIKYQYQQDHKNPSNNLNQQQQQRTPPKRLSKHNFCSLQEYNSNKSSIISNGADLMAFPCSQRLTCMQFDRTKIAYSSGGRNIRVFSLRDGRKLGSFGNKPIDSVTCMDYSNNILVSGHLDRVIRIYDWDSYECIKTNMKKDRHKMSITSCKLINNNIYTSSLDGTVKLWNVETNQCSTFMNHHDIKTRARSIVCMHVYNNNNFITGSLHNDSLPSYIGLWDTRCEHSLVHSKITNTVMRCIMSNKTSPHLVAAGGSNGIVSMYDTRFLGELNPTEISSSQYNDNINNTQLIQPVTSLHFSHDKLMITRPNVFSIFQTQTMPGMFPSYLYKKWNCDSFENKSILKKEFSCNSFITRENYGIPLAYEINHFTGNDLKLLQPEKYISSLSTNRPNKRQTIIQDNQNNNQNDIVDPMTFNQVRFHDDDKILALGTSAHVLVWGAKRLKDYCTYHYELGETPMYSNWHDHKTGKRQKTPPKKDKNTARYQNARVNRSNQYR